MPSPVHTPPSRRSSRLPLSTGSGRVTALVWALFFVSGLGQTVIVPLLPRIAVHDDLSDPAAAFVLALPGLAMLAVSVPAGMLVNRLGARRVTLGSGALLALGCGAQAVGGLDVLLAGRIVYGISFGVLWTAGAAWLSARPRDGAGAGAGGVGQAVVCSSVGTMIGPALGGLLGHGSSAELPFGLVTVAAAITTVMLALQPDLQPDPDSQRLAPQPDPHLGRVSHLGRGHGTRSRSRPVARRLRRRAGLQLRRSHCGDRWLTAGVGSLWVGGALSGTTQLLIARDLHVDGVSEGATGLAFSACAVGYIVTSAVFVRLGARSHTVRVSAIVTFLGAIALLPTLVSAAPVVLIGALLLTAAPRGAINVVAYGLAGRSDRPGGSVYGLLNATWGAATVLTPLAAGAVGQQDGPHAAYLVAIVPSLMIAVALSAMGMRARGVGRLTGGADGSVASPPAGRRHGPVRATPGERLVFRVGSSLTDCFGEDLVGRLGP